MAPVRENDILFAFKALTLIEGLSDSARRVGGAIIDHFNRRTGQCNPSVQRLAELLGLHRASIMRAIEQLHDLDLIQRVRHGSRTHCNAYLPNWARFNALVAEWDAKMKEIAAAESDVKAPSHAPVDNISKVAGLRRSRSQDCDFNSRTDATQTYLKNQSKEPNGACGNGARADSERFSVLSASPNGLMKGKARLGPRHEPEVVRAAARKAWEAKAVNDWHAKLRCFGVDAYAAIVERVSPEWELQLAKAEKRDEGEGMRQLREGLQLSAFHHGGG